MFNVTHKYNGGCVFFATVKPNGDHLVYLSAYGELASVLLKKYLEGQRTDYEELFAKWDKSFQKAIAQVGFTATHEAEDGYVYISTFQSGVGISLEDEAGLMKRITRGRRREPVISVLSPDLDTEMDEIESEDE